MNALGPLQQQVLDVLGKSSTPLPRLQLDRLCTLGKSLEAISRALDSLQIHDHILREDRGGIIYYRLAGTAPLAPKAELRVPALEPKSSPALKPLFERVLEMIRSQPMSGAQVAIEIGSSQNNVSAILRNLERRGIVVRSGTGNKTRFSIKSGTAGVTNLQAGATPAAQAQVADNSASEGAAPTGDLPSETSPAGSRDEPLTLEVDELEQRVDFYPGESEPGCDATATATLIDDATFALWSDGRLEVSDGDRSFTFTHGATRQLIDYLDRVCAIDTH